MDKDVAKPEVAEIKVMLDNNLLRISAVVDAKGFRRLIRALETYASFLEEEDDTTPPPSE